MEEKLIYKKICDIMADVKFIGKDGHNQKQNYKFRKIDDVYNEIHGLLAKHRVFTVPEILDAQHEERTSKSGGVLIYRIYTIRYKFFAEDGSFVETIVIGEGMDSGDKAGNKAMSVAHKYAIVQMFAIPTDEPKDPENDNPEVKGKTTKASKKTQTVKKENPVGPADFTSKDYFEHGMKVLDWMLKNKVLHPTAFEAEKKALEDLLLENNIATIRPYYMSLKCEKKKAIDAKKKKAESKEESVPTPTTAGIPAATETADLPEIF